MNNNHSSNEKYYKKRIISDKIKSAVDNFPVIVITGARQTGKSTFLINEFPNFKYISLDDYSILAQAQTDPASLWIDTNNIIIDEAQKAPHVFSYIKSAVDKTNRKMRFILSGSANMLLMKGISESLAGRAVYCELQPMTYGEIKESKDGLNNFMKLWNDDLKISKHKDEFIDTSPLMLKGFMPPLMYLKSLQDILLWWEGYIKTYIERDVRDLSQIESLIDFRRLLDSLGVRSGSTLNQSDLSRDTGISQPTVYRYLKILEISNIIRRIPAYAENKTKRIIKSPKVYLIDPALSVYLSGYHDIESLKNARELGGFFETMVLLHLSAYAEIMVPKAKIFYWRTTSGKEVDFIVEHGRKILAIEVKYTKNPTFFDTKNLNIFLEDNKQAIRGVIIHAGSQIKWLTSKIIAVPWWWIA